MMLVRSLSRLGTGASTVSLAISCPTRPLARAASRHLARISASTCRSAPWLERNRSEEHTTELQSLMRTSYAVFCLNKKTHKVAQRQPPRQHENARIATQ